jgi:glycine betaine/proline transport system permease protein
VYQGIQQNDIAKGFESGLGIVILALDRTTQAIVKNNNRKNNNNTNK